MLDPLESRYQQILELSQQMLCAGEAQEWDSLLDLERQRRQLFASLPSLQQDTSQDNVVDLIHKIQGSDQALLEKVECWLQHARILLRMPPKPDNAP